MSKKRRVAIIGSVGIPARYGGFETLAERLSLELSQNFDLSVYCSSKIYPDRPKTYNNVRLHFIPLKSNGVQGIFYDIWSILHALKRNDVLLILGVSGALILPFINFSRVKKIVHIDGLEWKRDKWKMMARRFLKFSEQIAIKYSDEIILDNKALENILIKTHGARRYQLITYGSEPLLDHFREEDPTPFIPYESYYLCISRIVPENNVTLILSAFTELSHLQLIFVGNWNVNSYSRSVYDAFKKFPNLDLRHPIYDQTKIGILRKNCLAYIHGHSAGGTNPSLVEAMRSGLPVFAFDVPFNRETMKSEGLYFSSKESLIDIIRSMCKPKLLEIGLRLKSIAETHYKWKEVASLYAKLFSENKGDK